MMEIQTRTMRMSRYYYQNNYTRTSAYTSQVFDDLKSFQKENILCDITLETEDGTKVFGHKVVFALATPYFRAMFTSFKERTSDIVILKEIDSTALKLLVDFIYTGQILLTEENVQVLLAASNFLQIQEIQDACCDLLKTHLHPTNCLSIRETADLYCLMELLSSSESYIKEHFLEVVHESDEFLSLSFEQLVKLISNNELYVLSEEKVFECIVCWVNHAPSSREEVFHKLLEHVRFPLLTRKYLLNTVLEEPLIKKWSECLNRVSPFQFLNCDQPGTDTICINPSPPKNINEGILVTKEPDIFKWHDPVYNLLKVGNTTINSSSPKPLKDGDLFPFYAQNTLFLSSTTGPCWFPATTMPTNRLLCGVAELNNCIFVVGGYHRKTTLNCAEIFNCMTLSWHEIANMSNFRYFFAIGVLEDIKHVIGDKGSHNETLKSVECYDSNINMWSPVADMSTYCCGAGVGVLNGVLYAVGGKIEKDIILPSVEAYSPITGVWTPVASMHKTRFHQSVITINGLSYIVGGRDLSPYRQNTTIEVYKPNSNTWTISTTKENGLGAYFIPEVTNINQLYLEK